MIDDNCGKGLAIIYPIIIYSLISLYCMPKIPV
jgi:hypothetical protein